MKPFQNDVWVPKPELVDHMLQSDPPFLNDNGELMTRDEITQLLQLSCGAARDELKRRIAERN